MISQELLERLAALAATTNPLALMVDSMEELGELSRCVKGKPNDEPAKNEAVDLAICAIAMFFASGGSMLELGDIMAEKTAKWESNIA